MEYIKEHGGAIICFRPESQSKTIARGVAASVLHKSGLGTKDEKNQLVNDDSFSTIPSILEDMGIESVRLISNNPSIVRKLRYLGVDVRGTVPLAVKTKSNIVSKNVM